MKQNEEYIGDRKRDEYRAMTKIGPRFFSYSKILFSILSFILSTVDDCSRPSDSFFFFKHLIIN